MDPQEAGMLLIGFGAGIFLTFNGFRQLKLKRLIQDIPTSRIGTGAVGSNVEIKGRVLPGSAGIFTAPISGIPCVFYLMEIQKWIETRDGGYWKTVDQFTSGNEILLDDGSGAFARVEPDDADIRFNGDPAQFEIKSNVFSRMPEDLAGAIRQNRSRIRHFKLEETSWIFSSNYRFLENRFTSHETLYVIGYADTGRKPVKKLKLQMKNFLAAKRMIEQDPKLREQYDANHDGALSEAEIETGAKEVGWQMELEEQERKEREAPLEPEFKMVFRKREPHVFIVSNMGEAELVKSFNLASTLQVVGGPILTLLAAYFFFQNGLGAYLELFRAAR